MKPRGFTLLLTLSLTALLFSLGMAVLGQVEALGERQRAQTARLQARALASSGCRYAQLMLRNAAWKAPLRFQSPDLNGTFALEVTALGPGQFRIVSTGRSAGREFTLRTTYP